MAKGVLSLSRHALEEATGHSIKKVILGLMVTLFSVASISAAGGFIYLKYLEARLHKDEKGLAEVISKPIGDEPINFLLLGSDARGKESARADTIILLHLDVKKKKAALVSIPRDMRVRIPDKGFDKINAAYAYGGPELMVRTVEDFSGFPIHHYVETDFGGFSKMVDALGGVDIYIDKPMRDKWSGAFFAAGSYTLDGPQALAYVRSRHSPRGDFDRVERQQKFLKAVYKKARSPASLTRLPRLISIFAENTTTDLGTTELLSFASLVRSIPEKNIETISLDGTSQRIKGKSYLIPNEAKNREILARVKEGKSLNKPVLGYSEQVSPKDVKVEVLNGCGKKGLARAASRKLEAHKFKVINVGDADKSNYSRTKVLYRKGQTEKAQCAANYLLPSAQLVVSNKIGSNVDVRIILGRDYKSGS